MAGLIGPDTLVGREATLYAGPAQRPCRIESLNHRTMHVLAPASPPVGTAMRVVIDTPAPGVSSVQLLCVIKSQHPITGGWEIMMRVRKLFGVGESVAIRDMVESFFPAVPLRASALKRMPTGVLYDLDVAESEGGAQLRATLTMAAIQGAGPPDKLRPATRRSTVSMRAVQDPMSGQIQSGMRPMPGSATGPQGSRPTATRRPAGATAGSGRLPVGERPLGRPPSGGRFAMHASSGQSGLSHTPTGGAPVSAVDGREVSLRTTARIKAVREDGLPPGAKTGPPGNKGTANRRTTARDLIAAAMRAVDSPKPSSGATQDLDLMELELSQPVAVVGEVISGRETQMLRRPKAAMDHVRTDAARELEDMEIELGDLDLPVSSPTNTPDAGTFGARAAHQTGRFAASTVGTAAMKPVRADGLQEHTASGELVGKAGRTTTGRYISGDEAYIGPFATSRAPTAHLLETTRPVRLPVQLQHQEVTHYGVAYLISDDAQRVFVATSRRSPPFGARIELLIDNPRGGKDQCVQLSMTVAWSHGDVDERLGGVSAFACRLAPGNDADRMTAWRGIVARMRTLWVDRGEERDEASLIGAPSPDVVTHVEALS